MAESFFLDSDEAKSMGNIDYMRTARKVKKSFPTTKAWGAGFKVEEEISAAMKNNFKNGQVSTAQSNGFSQEANTEISQRRKLDSGMDMFRNMAKEMRK